MYDVLVRIMLHMENEIGPVLNIPLMVRIQHGNTHDEYTMIKYNSCAFWTANRSNEILYVCYIYVRVHTFEREREREIFFEMLFISLGCLKEEQM